MTLPKNDIEKVAEFYKKQYRKLTDQDRFKQLMMGHYKSKGMGADEMNQLILNKNINWKNEFIDEEVKSFLNRFVAICVYPKSVFEP
tara:strand:- start:499 stop:759 length:261 start_codon:yes stop_codon:yes gene_type:complete